MLDDSISKFDSVPVSSIQFMWDQSGDIILTRMFHFYLTKTINLAAWHVGGYNVGTMCEMAIPT